MGQRHCWGRAHARHSCRRDHHRGVHHWNARHRDARRHRDVGRRDAAGHLAHRDARHPGHRDVGRRDEARRAGRHRRHSGHRPDGTSCRGEDAAVWRRQRDVAMKLMMNWKYESVVLYLA